MPVPRETHLARKMLPTDPGSENPCPDGFDTLYKLNHLFAKLRQDLSRLFRSTWATTKTLAGLNNHLMFYIAWQNRYTIT